MDDILKNPEVDAFNDAINRLTNKESIIYFLTYDTKNNPRASVKYIYDLALTLKQNGYNTRLLVEDKTYRGVSGWLGDKYNELPIKYIKEEKEEDKVSVAIDDTIIIPEYYSNALPQLANMRCNKLMLLQQKEYIFDTLEVGSRWSDYGIDKCITTTEEAKKYVNEFFPGVLTYVISPFIDDIFKPTVTPQKPYVAISCRDRIKQKKIISEFYLKNPHLRWITFRDMVQMTYEEFAEFLSECMVSIWIDDESTFGTFPLESMKCNVPVIGKLPNTKPDWLSENGVWVDTESAITEVLPSYILSWIDGQSLYDDFKEKMLETVGKYTKEIFEESVISVFSSLYNKKIENFTKILEKINEKETEKEVEK